MKKFYFLALALFTIGLSAQINDDFESYPEGPYFGEHWGNWSGNASENIVISTDQAASGTKSGHIGNDNTQDAILKLGNKFFGTYTVQWKMYIPAGDVGYYNFQEDENTSDGIWALNFHFNDQDTGATPGVGKITDDANPGNVVSTFDYPEDTWFTMTHEINLDNNTVIVKLNGTEIYSGDFYSQTYTLGGVDFYSVSNRNNYYIDDVVFVEGQLGVSDIASKAIATYPNPVQDFLYVNAKVDVSEVVVYNTAGQQVLKTSPKSSTTKIDMSSLASGVYVVKITAGNEVKTSKVVVK